MTDTRNKALSWLILVHLAVSLKIGRAHAVYHQWRYYRYVWISNGNYFRYNDCRRKQFASRQEMHFAALNYKKLITHILLTYPQ